MKDLTIEAPWSQGTDEIYSKLATSQAGLTTSQVEERQSFFGKNILQKEKSGKILKLLLNQFKSWLVMVLIVAATISFFLGEKIDALVILSIVALSSIFGFLQEYGAEKVVENLGKYISHKANVLRDGAWSQVDSTELVVGDVVKLHVGDRVPADLRLTEIGNLTIDEAILTGESLSVEKNLEKVERNKTLPQDQKNLAFMSTYVVSGSAVGVVVRVGSQTLLGKTAILLEQKEPETDFQKQISNFSSFLFKIILVLTVFVFIANAALAKGVFPSFLFAVALAVGITPELLPAIITVTLSQGARKMAKKKVVVKKLMAVEDFGNIDTLCTDKTGTLTKGEFLLADYLNPIYKQDREVLNLGLMCSTGFATNGKLTSNQTDKALWANLDLNRVEKELKNFKLLKENEFDYEKRLMSAVVTESGKTKFVAKGAWENVLDSCDKFVLEGKDVEFSKVKKANLIERISQYELDGNRVIGVATAVISESEIDSTNYQNLTLNGLILFTDPVKEDAARSLELFNKLGVAIKVLSGDSQSVVAYVAEKIGLKKDGDIVVTGDQLINLSDKEIDAMARKYSLFARVTPEQKFRLVSCLNKDGHIVGFLGDGVNDAPALKAGDVGIAVDTGAGVAKEAADIVLLEKDLKVLSEGIVEGRKIFSNITKYIRNTTSANYGNMFTVAVSSLFLPFIPLLPTQIVLNNFLSDIPLLAIATDNVDPGMTRRPRKWDIPFIAKFMVYFGFISSFFDLALILPLIFIFNASPEIFRTAWFVESALSQMLIAFVIRTRLPFYKSRPSSWLVNISLIVGGFVLILPLLPLSHELFQFTVPPLLIMIWVAVVLVCYFFTTELLKHFFYSRFEKA